MVSRFPIAVATFATLLAFTLAPAAQAGTVFPAFLEFQVSDIVDEPGSGVDLVLVEVFFNANDGKLLSMIIGPPDGDTTGGFIFDGPFNEISSLAFGENVNTTDNQAVVANLGDVDPYNASRELDTVFYQGGASDQVRGMWSSVDPCDGVSRTATGYSVCLATGSNSMFEVLKLADLIVANGSEIFYNGELGRDSDSGPSTGTFLAIVPEPTTHALVLGALALVAAVGRRAPRL